MDYSWYLFPREIEQEPEPPMDASELELLAHDLVNQERVKGGLSELVWNQRVAEVARAHSQDMGENNYTSHEDLEGGYHDNRLGDAGIYYYNMSGENIAKGSIVTFYTVNVLGEIVSKEYRTREQMIEAVVDGWMESPRHRDNILKPEYGEAGTGIARTPDNETYYFTQVFITRTGCGYKTGPCCVEIGYMPYCYEPGECIEGICE